MSEDNVNKDNENADDVATLQAKLDKTENEKVALEMKLRESDDDLYSEDYLSFLQAKKEKNRSTASGYGGRMSDFTDEQLQGMDPAQMAKAIAGEVYSQIRNESDMNQTRTERDAQKKRVAKARVEIKDFAAKRPDFREVAPTIKDLGEDNPKLSLAQLYQLAGGKFPDGVKKDVKEDNKTKQPPNTKPTGEGGMKKSDKDLSIREVIAQEWQKNR